MAAGPLPMLLDLAATWPKRPPQQQPQQQPQPPPQQEMETAAPRLVPRPPPAAPTPHAATTTATEAAATAAFIPQPRGRPKKGMKWSSDAVRAPPCLSHDSAAPLHLLHPCRLHRHPLNMLPVNACCW